MASLTPSVDSTHSQATAHRMGPAELPGSARFYTLASGVAEAATGTLLLAPRTRRVGAIAAIALFVGVFPANVNSVRVLWNKGWPARIGTIGRLPLQIPMITQALKVYRNAPR
jgi:uncharacterized membrane protein